MTDTRIPVESACRPRGCGPLTPERVCALLCALQGEVGAADLVDARWNGAHSNDVFTLRFDDGRILMVKQGKHDWVADLFRAARVASTILRERVGILAPDPIPLPEDALLPVQAYWRIPLPTLAELWPTLNAGARAAALRSLGALVRRVHDVRLAGWGPLPDALKPGSTLAEALHKDFAGRLLPAVAAIWPEAYSTLERLSACIPAAARRVRARSVLAHNDLHMHNVLCRVDDGTPTCVGLLDLDGASGAPPESDLARFDVLHGRLFGQRIERPVRERMREGYRGSIDETVLAFFRTAHLANLGFHSALVGDVEHAAEVAAVLAVETQRAEALCSASNAHTAPAGTQLASRRDDACATGALPLRRRHATGDRPPVRCRARSARSIRRVNAIR